MSDNLISKAPEITVFPQDYGARVSFSFVEHLPGHRELVMTISLPEVFPEEIRAQFDGVRPIIARSAGGGGIVGKKARIYSFKIGGLDD